MTEQPDEPHGSGHARRPETVLALVRRFSRLWGFALFLVAVLVLFRGIVLPFVFATIVAYLLAPVIQRLQPRLGRPLAVILIYLVLVAVLVVFFGLLLPAVLKDFARLRDTAPVLLAKLNEEWIPQVSDWMDHAFGQFMNGREPTELPPEMIVTPMADGSWKISLETGRLVVQEIGDGSYTIGPPDPAGDDVGESLRHLVAAQGSQITTVLGRWLQAFVAGVTGFLTKFVITFMLAAFMLIDLDRVNGFIRSLVPPEYRESFDEIVRGLDRGLSGVIRGQLLICLVNGVLTFIGLLIFDIKYSFLLAVLAGVFSLIPIFGTILSSIPIVVIALVASENASLTPALAILGWIAMIHLLEANFLNPKIIGDSAHIHPVVVVFALLAGEYAYGLVGALLAVPVASMVQTVFLFARARVLQQRGESAGITR